MEEKKMSLFYWTSIFLVTGFCFFSFGGIIEFLNHSYPALFFWIGCISLFLGLLNIIAKIVSISIRKNRRKLSP